MGKGGVRWGVTVLTVLGMGVVYIVFFQELVLQRREF